MHLSFVHLSLSLHSRFDVHSASYDGISLGTLLGNFDGKPLGRTNGTPDGILDGTPDGATVGSTLGRSEVDDDGEILCRRVGGTEVILEGIRDGAPLGTPTDTSLGKLVGYREGSLVGVFVGYDAGGSV